MQNNTANTLNKASLKKQIHKVKLENKWTKHKATKNSKTRVSIACVSIQHRKISINLVTSL